MNAWWLRIKTGKTMNNQGLAAANANADRSVDGEDNLLLWILVWSELAVFGALIAGYLIASLLNPEIFTAARLELGARLAGLNTVILLASGWQAALAVTAGNLRVRQLHLGLAAFLGFVFAAVKIAEYAGEWHLAAQPEYRAFFEIYMLLTGFHLAHVVFVALLMIFVAFRARRSNVAAVAIVWHVIDLVWLVMFPLVYLV